MDPETAELLAIKALSFIAEDEKRTYYFCQTTGLHVPDLTQLKESADFLVGVLDYFLSNEPLLLEFSIAKNIAPESIFPAYYALGGLIANQ